MGFEMFSIYLITNTKNGKVYVGVTCKTVEYRINQHVRGALRGNVDMAICRAIKAHGKEFFTISVLDFVEDASAAYKSEEMWITRYDSFNHGYNMTHGGEVGWQGPKSVDHKRRIGEANTGKKRPDLAERNRSQRGVRLSPTRRQAIRDSQYIWVSCLKCKIQASTTEFNRRHNTNKHFHLPHGNTRRRPCSLI